MEDHTNEEDTYKNHFIQIIYNKLYRLFNIEEDNDIFYIDIIEQRHDHFSKLIISMLKETILNNLHQQLIQFDASIIFMIGVELDNYWEQLHQ